MQVLKRLHFRRGEPEVLDREVGRSVLIEQLLGGEGELVVLKPDRPAGQKDAHAMRVEVVDGAAAKELVPRFRLLVKSAKQIDDGLNRCSGLLPASKHARA